MPQPLRMHQIKRIIELQLQGQSIRQIARLTGLSRNTVRDYLRRMSASGMSWEQLLSLDDDSLIALVYVDANEKLAAGRSVDNRLSELKSHLETYSLELKKRGVTKQLLWEEYRKTYTEGYGYTRFCAYFNQHL